jgi:hypothetical protein
MRLEIRWPPEDDEVDQDSVDMSRTVGLQPADLDDLATVLPPEARLSIEPSSIGKGASGPAIAVVVEVERITADTASLIAIGSVVRAVIRRLRQRRSRDPIIEDETTLATLAADGMHETLAGRRYAGMRPLVASPGIGADQTDMWAAVFIDDDRGSVLLAFISPQWSCTGGHGNPLRGLQTRVRVHREVDRRHSVLAPTPDMTFRGRQFSSLERRVRH